MRCRAQLPYPPSSGLLTWHRQGRLTEEEEQRLYEAEDGERVGHPEHERVRWQQRRPQVHDHRHRHV
jgi:hypothetical protein